MYHAHVYFGLLQKSKATELKKKIEQQRSDIITQFPLVERLVGPHLMPMFEIHFKDNSQNFIEWLDENRNGMDVLIHPVGADDLMDHTEHAIWLGRELGIDEAGL